MPDHRKDPVEFMRRLRNFGNERAEFSKKLEPFGDLVAKHVRGETTNEERRALLKFSKEMSRKLSATADPYPQNYLRLEREYRENVAEPLNELAASYNLLKQKSDPEDIKIQDFVADCEIITDIADYINNFKGYKCQHSKFSPKIASVIFDFLDKYEFEEYSLSTQHEQVFKICFGAIYFHLVDQEKKNGDSSYILQRFMQYWGNTFAKNKALLLLEVTRYRNIDVEFGDMSDCIPLSFFVILHFKRKTALETRSEIEQSVTLLRNMSGICAKMINPKNPEEERKLLAKIEEKIAYLNPFLTKWFDALLESTWPKTESDIVQGIVKEIAHNFKAAPGFPESVKYKHIAKQVHDQMSSIGNPKYLRQYIVTKEYITDNKSGAYVSQCKLNRCSRASSMEVQCTILRVPNNTDEIGENLLKLESFAQNINSTVQGAMERKYMQEPLLSKVVDQLSSNENVDLRQFVNHSSFIGLRYSRYRSYCMANFGTKAEEGLGTSALQIFRYHDDGGFISMCYDWVFMVGV